MLSNNWDQRTLPMKDRCRRGLLPLKKRKVSLDFTVSRANENQSCHDIKNEDLKHAYGNCSQHDAKGTPRGFFSDDENTGNLGMTALSLIASAAASEEFRHNEVPRAPGGRTQNSSLSLQDSVDEQIGHRLYAMQSDYSYDSLYSGSSSPHPPSGELDVKTLASQVHKTKSLQNNCPQGQQDKRYTGGDGEIRCLATTTRGRACAYIAVDGTKYCHLHSDYDTNPPPRRGGIHKGKQHSNIPESAVPIVVGNVKEANLRGLENLGGVQVVPNCSPPSVSSEELSRLTPSDSFESQRPNKRSRRSTSSKLAAKHADSPFPLLSMISTDQWYHKSVKVASGPMEGRVGKVEKWGNGWVSLNIPGVGLHNRRSFELYLDDSCDVETGKVNQVEQHARQDVKDSNQSLFRCVSRDIVSPLPCTPFNQKGFSSNTDFGSSNSVDGDGVHKFKAAPHPNVSGKPRPLFERGFNSELSPIPSKGASVEVPKVTPLPPKGVRPYDEAVAIASGLQIPQTDGHQFKVSMKRNNAASNQLSQQERINPLVENIHRKVSLEPNFKGN